MSRAEIIVDLAAIRANVRTVRGLLRDATALMVVVKADGYGHGMVPVARAARAAGAQWLGVATVDEALALRASGDRGPVLCWLTVPGEAYAEAIAAGIDLTAYTVAELAEINAAAEKVGRPARVQLKVDTGLSRGGAPVNKWPALVKVALKLPHVQPIGVWSHFACADDPTNPANEAQEKAFRVALGVAREQGMQPQWGHLANSAATLTRPSSRFNLVRLGIGAYGLDPAPGVPHGVPLRPAMTVRAQLAMTKPVRPGEGVSYGHAWVAETPTTLGLVPLGYAEGIPVAASNAAEVTLAGVRRPVRGRICMDQFLVDLGPDSTLAPGATVTVFGGDGPSVQEWAEACGTINYEIVTRIGGRLQRRYIDTESGEETK